MPPKTADPIVQCECKTADGKLCWNSGAHVVEGRHVCGTHAKGCKGGFATHAELEASAIEFQQRRAVKSEKASHLKEFKALEGQTGMDRVLRTAKKVNPKTSSASFVKLQSEDRTKVAAQQAAERKKLRRMKEFLRRPKP